MGPLLHPPPTHASACQPLAAGRRSAVVVRAAPGHNEGMHDTHQITSLTQLQELIGEATAVTTSKLVDNLGPLERRFIDASPFLLLATAGSDGRLSLSPRGDAPGFVAVEDERTLVIPERPGNRLLFSAGNMLENPHVALLFMIPQSEETLRVEGTVTLTKDPAVLASLAARGRAALFALRVTVERCYFHCGKAFLRSQLWRPEQWAEPFGFTWGEWTKERFGFDDAGAAKVDQMIAQDAKDNL